MSGLIGRARLAVFALYYAVVAAAAHAGTALAPAPVAPTTTAAPAGGLTLSAALELVAFPAAVGLIIVTITWWWRRPPRICRKCRCVRLPLNATPGELMPDDMQVTPAPGLTLATHTCRYTCSCETGGVTTSHTIWLTFPPPNVSSCPERLSIEVCWRGSAVEPPKITIE